jgi:hypothetical protein
MAAWSIEITFLDHDVLRWTIQAHHQGGGQERSPMAAWSADITFLDPDVLEWTVQAYHRELFPPPERRSKTLTNGGMEL